MNDRRGEPDNHSIPTNDAWDFVAKMLFPDEPVRAPTKRDAWLINRYPPNDILKNVPASLLPGGVTYVAGMLSIPVPNALIAEVDRAHFRLSLRNEVFEWFERHGFDASQRTIPKDLFEAAVQAEFGQLPPEPVKPIEKGAAKAKLRKPKPRKRNTTDDALVAAPGKEPTPRKKYKRFTADDDLVDEGVNGIPGTWPNASQAANALADRAKGNTRDSTVTRLRKKISKKIGTALEG